MANNEALHVFLFGARIAALGPLGRLLKCKRLKLHRGPPPASHISAHSLTAARAGVLQGAHLTRSYAKQVEELDHTSRFDVCLQTYYFDVYLTTIGVNDDWYLVKALFKNTKNKTLHCFT